MKNTRVLWDLFNIFLKIGGFTFGGGLAMLPLIQNEVVDKRRWVTEEEVVDIFAICQSVPGVIAINSAIFIGNKVAGKKGAISATLGVTLPAFLAIILAITVLTGLQGNKHVQSAFAGIMAASTALILLSAIKLGKGAVKGGFGLILAGVAFLAIVIFNIHAALVIFAGGIAGYIVHLIKGGAGNV